MTMLKISQFNGILPKVGTRLLPDTFATEANNINLQSGELRPLYGLNLVNTPNNTLPALTIYLARDRATEQAWFTWGIDIDVVRAPLSVDVDSRFFWTGDGAPQYSTYSQATAGGGGNYPSASYTVGIPTPQTKPSVSASGGTGLAATRAYLYTYFSALGEESSPSPVSTVVTGKVDDTWAISAMDAFPLNSGTVTGAYASGSTTFTGASLHWLRVGDSVVISGATLIVTAVTSAYIFKVVGDYHTATTWARKHNWNTIGMKRRLYRTTGTTGSYQLVADDIGTTYSDTLTDLLILGDELISIGWTPPPVGLTNVTVHPSGALVGFSGNQICFSEPYQPHAWPVVYQLSTDYDCVGLNVYGSEIGVGTKGNPYIVSGVDPSSMTLQKVDGMYPCLAKKSILGIGDGFMYATTHGLVMIGASGVSVYTDKFYTKNEWSMLDPASMIATGAYGRIYLSYSVSDTRRELLIMDGDVLLTSDIQAFDIYTDIGTGELYISNAEGINEWDSASAFKLNTNWRSKDYVLPKPVNFGAAKIDFDMAVSEELIAKINADRNAAIANNNILILAGQAGGEMNDRYYGQSIVNQSDFLPVDAIPPSNSLTFILRKGEDVIISRAVNSTRAFRLPAGYKSDVFSIEILTQCSVREIRIAETMDELGTG